MITLRTTYNFNERKKIWFLYNIYNLHLYNFWVSLIFFGWFSFCNAFLFFSGSGEKEQKMRNGIVQRILLFGLNIYVETWFYLFDKNFWLVGWLFSLIHIIFNFVWWNNIILIKWLKVISLMERMWKLFK